MKYRILQITLLMLTTVIIMPVCVFRLNSGGRQISYETLDYCTRQVTVDGHTMNAEEFLLYALAAQLDPFVSKEALKAAAVVVRSQLWYQMDQAEKGSSIVMDYLSAEQMQERWAGNYTEYYNRLRSVVEDTACQVLEVEGTLVDPPWYRSGNGMTRTGDPRWPWLQPVQSQEEENGSSVSVIFWNQEQAEEYLGQLAGTESKTVEETMAALRLERDDADYVTHVYIAEQEYTGEEIRQKFDFPSCCFYMDPYEKGVRITVKGNGNGYGMSLSGACQMAGEGAKAEEILNYYYQGAQVVDRL